MRIERIVVTFSCDGQAEVLAEFSTYPHPDKNMVIAFDQTPMLDIKAISERIWMGVWSQNK